MKTPLLILFVAYCLISCNASKSVTTTENETPAVVTETVVVVPEITKIEDTLAVSVEQEVRSTPAISEIVVKEEGDIQEKLIPKETSPEPTAMTFDHSALHQLLQQNVTTSGEVDYAKIKASWSSLRAYIKALGENMPTEQWSKDEKLAYWMNAYNAMTIDLILRHQPLESIKDIKNPWEQRFWKLGNKYYNLDEIEHQILRKMGDPRIHFGINCASFSCPPLLNEAFTAQKVDSQLEALAVQFVNDSQRNTITPDRVEVSKIFNWFAKDFKTNGSLIDYLNKYSSTQISPSAKVRYKDYDWSLND